MLKEVGGAPIQSRHRATCHCGAVVLELDLPDGSLIHDAAIAPSAVARGRLLPPCP